MSKSIDSNNWEDFISAKDETLIGSLVFLKNWIIRTELTNALDKVFIRNIITNEEEELIFTDEKVYDPSVSLRQKDRDTDEIYISYSTPKTQNRTYLYNIKTKEKKLVKEQIIPSGHEPNDYIVERLECPSLTVGLCQLQ